MKPYYEDPSGIVIYHGDCREILPALPRVDLVLTDPPYGENTHAQAKTNKGAGHGVKLVEFASITGEELGRVLALCGQSCKRWTVATMEWRHVAALEATPPDGLRFMRFGVWVKANGMPQISADRPAQGWEAIAYLHNAGEKPRWNGGGKSGNYVLPIEQGEHPTTKPLPMLLSLVERFTDEGETILDPFMGSGTTLVAAKRLGRKAIGIEIEGKYCEIAARRIQEASMPLLEAIEPRQEMLLEWNAAIDRCDQEIAAIDERPDVETSPAYLSTMGRNDWEHEKRLIRGER